MYPYLRGFCGPYESTTNSNQGDGSLGAGRLNSYYYRRMMWPDEYKCNTMSITKFEKDFQYRIDYQFYNIFPKIITAVPLSYGGAEVLKLTVSFNYDRYIVNPVQNISRGEIGRAHV